MYFNCKIIILFLAFISIVTISQSLYAQGLPEDYRYVDGAIYSHEYVNNDLIIYRQCAKVIESYYLIQDVLPLISMLDTITSTRLNASGTCMMVQYNGDSQVSFSTSEKTKLDKEVHCAGISYHIDDSGFSKEKVRQMVVSLQ